MDTSPETPSLVIAAVVPLELQLLILDQVWRPYQAIWTRKALRAPLRAVCRAWRDNVDEQDDAFAIVTSEDQARWHVARAVDGTLPHMRKLVVRLWPQDHPHGQFLFGAGRMAWKLIVMGVRPRTRSYCDRTDAACRPNSSILPCSSRMTATTATRCETVRGRGGLSSSLVSTVRLSTRQGRPEPLSSHLGILRPLTGRELARPPARHHLAPRLAAHPRPERRSPTP